MGDVSRIDEVSVKAVDAPIPICEIGSSWVALALRYRRVVEPERTFGSHYTFCHCSAKGQEIKA